LNPLEKPPQCAMVLAAGLGKRMRPLTDTAPKPLIKVWDKTLLDHGLDALEQAGVQRAVVNVHYLADQIESHLHGRTRPKIVFSDEREKLLDSGGGIKKALTSLGPSPFYLLNADSFWIEGYSPNLQSLAGFWDSGQMDILLLTATMDRAVGFEGKGDFFMDPSGRLTRRGERRMAPYVYAGAALISPTIFDDTPEGAFSLNNLFDRAIENGKLFGMQMDGLWLHVGTPEAIIDAERAIAKSAA
jgi:MurNAc alpha-1-phosphate uridylyltransferase